MNSILECASCCSECRTPIIRSESSDSNVQKCGFSYDGETVVYLTQTGAEVLGGSPDIITYDPNTCIPTTTPGIQGCNYQPWSHEGQDYLRLIRTLTYNCHQTVPYDPVLFPNAPTIFSDCISSGTIIQKEEYLGLIYSQLSPEDLENQVYPSGYDPNDLCKKYTSISGSVDSTSIQYNISSSGNTPETTNDTLCTRSTITSLLTITENSEYGQDGTKDPQETISQTNEYFAYAACNNGEDQVLSYTSNTYGPYSWNSGGTPLPNATLCGSGCFVETVTFEEPYSLEPITYSDEFTTNMLKTKLNSNFTAFTGKLSVYGYVLGVTRYLSEDEIYLSASRARYAFSFPLPKSKRCYRVKWVERFIRDEGVGLTSIEVVSPGVYRPDIGISSPPPGGTQALAVASMSLTGTVQNIKILNPGSGYIPKISFIGGEGSGAEAIAVIDSSGAVISVIIVNEGSGYTSAPTVSFTDVSAPRIRATGNATILKGKVTKVDITTAGDFRPTIGLTGAVEGGVSSTNWVCTLDPSSGMVTSITGGSGGDYRPTLSFFGGGGSGAAGVINMNEQGGIDSVSLISAGSDYASGPSLRITSKIPNILIHKDAILQVHLGIETTKCEKWDGKTLAGRWVKRVPDYFGHPLSSVEVIYGGSGYDTPPTISIDHPTTLEVEISPPSNGGVQARALANIDSSGNILSISIVEGGAGYLSPPAIKIPAPAQGGTQSIGWSVTLTGGKVTSIDGGTHGDYSIAATANMVDGKISSITLTKRGAGFKIAPAITISPRKGNLLLAAHFGDETEYSDGNQPIGCLPVGYVEGDEETYPLIGNSGTAPWKYFELPAPSSNGTTVIANVQSICDCSSCT